MWIDCDNAAFAPDVPGGWRGEVERILAAPMLRAEGSQSCGKLYDVNGNYAGNWSYDADG